MNGFILDSCTTVSAFEVICGTTLRQQVSVNLLPAVCSKLLYAYTVWQLICMIKPPTHARIFGLMNYRNYNTN